LRGLTDIIIYSNTAGGIALKRCNVLSENMLRLSETAKHCRSYCCTKGGWAISVFPLFIIIIIPVVFHIPILYSPIAYYVAYRHTIIRVYYNILRNSFHGGVIDRKLFGVSHAFVRSGLNFQRSPKRYNRYTRLDNIIFTSPCRYTV